ncbi:MAG TPA: hypothetical protein VG034_01840 [Acidimicrobiia bacterium]|jgi:hypothetical protein|nr:hypothetical protein [Acidimicrobiia bacterium]
MRSRIPDAILIATVGTAVIVTGSALYGLGRRLPPPPEVRPTPPPAPQVVPDRCDPPQHAARPSAGRPISTTEIEPQLVAAKGR